MRRHHRGASATSPTFPQNPNASALLRSFDSDANPSKPMRPSPLTTNQAGMPLDLLNRLRSFPLFVSAPDEFLAAIATHLRPQLHSPRDYILTEGDEAKAMYWLVRGAVSVTSRDGESTYAELKPGAFFGEIGILMDVPRTATIIARSKCMLVVLTKEALRKELPKYPDVEKAIREEAMERLELLEKKKKEGASKLSAGGAVAIGKQVMETTSVIGPSLIPADGHSSVVVGATGSQWPTSNESVVASGELNVRQLLKELPLFANLPAEVLHFLGMNATPRTYPPFSPIILKDSPGREIFFIIRGEVEVVDGGHDPNGVNLDDPSGQKSVLNTSPTTGKIKARLQKGQYFGEVAGLGLVPKRMATVRSVNQVECIVIEGPVLEELWRRWTTEMKREVELTARKRLATGTPQINIANATAASAVVATAPASVLDRMEMDLDSGALDSGRSTPSHGIERMDLGEELKRLNSPLREPPAIGGEPSLKISVTPPDGQSPSPHVPGINVVEPYDPDPFLPPDFENMRAKSRRGSIAPPIPQSSPPPESDREGARSPSHGKHKHPTTPPEYAHTYKRPRVHGRRTTQFNKGALTDDILVRIFTFLPLHELMKIRLVSTHWSKIVSTNNDVMKVLDLKPYNRVVTDHVLINYICPFAGSRPLVVDLSNCFHITDEGFLHLAAVCAPNVKIWRMKSVWDITGQAILEMANKAKGLEEIDLSNCRKVSDQLLQRVAGWVIQDIPHFYDQYQQQQQQNMDTSDSSDNESNQQQQQQGQQQGQQTQQGQGHLKPSQRHPMLFQPPPGTVIGCPSLKRLVLSYCKHVTDRTMSHLAQHAASRLEHVDLTRCTTITDQGFQHWSLTRFPRLTNLCLADCTYLTDSAIVFLTNAAKNLRVLDLSFCCALSDTATEVLSLGCPHLTVLKLSFCGSAVSDSSLRAIGLHLLELRELSVRGCVRVTGIGVEAVVEGCHNLEVFDVSQCKNLTRWLDAGGVEHCRKKWKRNVRFETVAANVLAGDRRR